MKIFSARSKHRNPAYHDGSLAYSNGLSLAETPYTDSESEQRNSWESGWRDAEHQRARYEGKKEKDTQAQEEWKPVYGGTAIIVSAVTFLGSWIYAIVVYGWFLGLAFGWIPSLIVALIMFILYPFIIRIIFGLLILLFAVTLIALVVYLLNK